MYIKSITGGKQMESAFEQLTRLLKSTGMDDKEIDHLLARFLEEEAFDYVEYINDNLSDVDLEKIAAGLIC